MKTIIDKYKLVVFDLDGTLVHTTAEYRYFVVPQTLKDLGKNFLKVIVKQEDSTFLVITFHWLEKRRVK